jgi:hypothetical protein
LIARADFSTESWYDLTFRSIKEPEGGSEDSNKIVLPVLGKKNIVAVFLTRQKRKLAAEGGPEI